MTSLDSQLRESKPAKKPKHKCFYAPYMTGCLRCRNENRWKYYSENPNPIYGKGLHRMNRASVPGRG